MKNVNNYQAISDTDNKKCKFSCFSILSWLMCLICGLLSLIWFIPGGIGISVLDIHYYYYCIFMTIYRLELVEKNGENVGIVYPLQMQTFFLYVIIILTMIFLLFGFIVFIKSKCNEKKAVLNGIMHGNVTRFHFVPLLFAAGLFLIGICYYQNIKDPDWKSANKA